MTDIKVLGEKAKKAKFEMNKISTQMKNDALHIIAEDIVKNTNLLLEANSIDVAAGEKNGMHSGLIDRLRLTPDRI